MERSARAWKGCLLAWRGTAFQLAFGGQEADWYELMGAVWAVGLLARGGWWRRASWDVHSQQMQGRGEAAQRHDQWLLCMRLCWI